jgi:hypothetical protein
MLILRCTQKLRRKKLGPLTQQEDSLLPTLGSWHANLVYIAKTPLVLCVNDRSLLSVLVPGREFPKIFFVIRRRIGERLRRMGLPSESILREEAAMEIVDVQLANNKSVLGSMNDFVHSLKWQRDRFNVEEAAALEDMLSQTPMGALNYEYPVEVA